MDLNEIKNNIQKFFRGEETEEGRRLIDRWYDYFENKPDELAGYSEAEKEKLRQQLWHNIEDETGLAKSRFQLKNHDYSSNRREVWKFKVAAGFIIALLVALPVLYYQGFIFSQNQMQSQITYMTASNPAGQTSRIVLADGSTVWLSAASSLRYPKRFDGNDLRSVYLMGEAFFDVTHNPDKPFVVHSGELQTKVLGTSFNIRSFEAEHDVQITVATGRVSVKRDTVEKEGLAHTDRSIAVLTPDQQLVFDKETSKGLTKTVNSSIYTSWKDGKLIFENQSFKEIAQRLERWYGVQIHFSDADLEQVRFKITFANNSLQHALKMLQVIEDFKFKMKDNQVWIEPAS